MDIQGDFGEDLERKEESHREGFFCLRENISSEAECC
jgi:hypothetical protein